MSFFFELGSISFTLALFIVHCAVVGFAISSLLKLWPSDDAPHNNAYLKGFFAISIGVLVNVAMLFALGMLAWLNRPVVLLAGLLLALLAMPRCFAMMREAGITAQPAARRRIASTLEVLVLLTLFFVVVLCAFKAPGHWDDTSYHLPLARFYLQREAIVLHEYVRFPLFPQNIDLLLALGLMLGNVVTAQAFATLPLFIAGIGLIGTGKWLLGSILPGVLATSFMILLPVVKGTLGYAYIDNGLALFCWGATLALAQAMARDKERNFHAWLIIAGLLAGGAAGSKYFGGVLAVVLGLILLAQSRSWKACAIYAASVLLAGSWWYLRSVVISGDPLHPVGGNIFGHFLWNAADLLSQQQEQATYGVFHQQLGFWAAFSKAGLKYWVLAFASLLFYKSAPIPVRIFQLVFAAYFVCWFFGFQVQRYLAPIYAAGSFLSIYFLYRVFSLVPLMRRLSARPNSWPAPPAGVLSLLIFIISAAYHYSFAQSEMAHWNSRLEKRAGFVLFGEANKLIPNFGPRMVQFGFENAVFFFDGVAIGDWFGPGRYSNFVTREGDKWRLIEPQVMRRRMEQLGSRMLALKTEELTFDAVAYQTYFKVAAQTSDGLLLVAK